MRERLASQLSEQELLYVPLSKGGKPRRIVQARTLGRLLDDLLAWLPESRLYLLLNRLSGLRELLRS